MKKLKNEFKKGGLTYRLKKRDGNVAMYNVLHDDKAIAIEVVKVRIIQADNLFFDQEREKVPSLDEFGRKGWSYNANWGAKKAEQKYQELLTAVCPN